MSRHNEYDDGEDEEELSSSGSDDGFDEDMEALKRACMITGTNPDDLEYVDNENNNAYKPTSVSGNGGCGGGGAASDLESEDDLELFRSIRSRFSLSEDAVEPLSMKPLCTLPPVISADDDEDDFETLRAIQRRFSAYDGSDTPRNYEKVLLRKPEQVHASGIASENGTSNDMFMNRTNACKGFPDSDQACDTILDSEQACNTIPDSEQACDTIPDSEQACDTFPDSELCDNIPDSLAACNIIPDSDEACNLVHLLSENVAMPSADLIEWDQSGPCKSSTLSFRHSSFPETAQVFIDAIKRNRSYQRFLRSKLIHIEARIEENKKLKECVKILRDFQVSCKKITGRALSQKKDPRVQLISARKSGASDDTEVNDKKVSAMHCGPTENSHVASYRMALTKFPLSLDHKKWSREEKENLAKGIRQQIQEMLLQVSVDRFSGSEGSSEDANNLDSIILSIKDLEITPELIRQLLPKVNWNKLASMYVVGRSGSECETRWLNWEDPLVNHNPWTHKEDKNLLVIIREKGITNWLDIAVSLGTNRTPFQCLERYQRSLNACILKREWTKDEDDQLRMAVGTFGEHDWQSVASVLKRRTGTQCSNRWKKSLHPTRLRVGRWTPDEDKRLKVAVMLFAPKNWKKVAQFVPGRTQVQCRERWVNSLDPSLNLGKWTEEEDSRLKAAIAEHGYCWSKVAARLPSRTDNQCWRRWKALVPQEVPLLQEARRMRKVALICNFVDRESERPALGPTDFMALPMISSVPEPENMNPSRKHKRKLRRQESENGRDVASWNVQEKIRSKRPRKGAKSSSQQFSGKTNSHEVETIDESDQKKKTRKPHLKSAPKQHSHRHISAKLGKEQNSVSPEKSVLPGTINDTAVVHEVVRPGSQQNLGTQHGDDATLASIPRLKLKKKHEITKSQPHSSSSKRLGSKGTQMLSRRVNQLTEGKQMLSLMQSSHLKDTQTIVASDIELGKIDLVEGKIIASHEAAREAVNVNLENDFDVTLAHFLFNSSKRQRTVASNEVTHEAGNPPTVNIVASDKEPSRKGRVEGGSVAMREAVNTNKEDDFEAGKITLARFCKRLKKQRQTIASNDMPTIIADDNTM